MLQRGRRARSEGSCIPELSLLPPPSASSELWCGRGGPSGAGAAQVTRSPGLQVSQTTAHIPALPRGRPTPALCLLALPHLWQLPPPPGLFLPVSSLVSKGPGGRGCCCSGRGPQTSQCHLSSLEKSALGRAPRGSAHPPHPLLFQRRVQGELTGWGKGSAHWQSIPKAPSGF